MAEKLVRITEVNGNMRYTIYYGDSSYYIWEEDVEDITDKIELL